MTEVTVDDFVVALVVLAEAGIPSDIQELLVRGDPSRSIKPNALIDCLESLRSRAQLWNDNRDLRGTIDVERAVALTERYRAEAAEATCEKLAAALEKIAEQPREYKDKYRSYGVGWAFNHIQDVARAALTTYRT